VQFQQANTHDLAGHPTRALHMPQDCPYRRPHGMAAIGRQTAPSSDRENRSAAYVESSSSGFYYIQYWDVGQR